MQPTDPTRTGVLQAAWPSVVQGYLPPDTAREQQVLMQSCQPRPQGLTPQASHSQSGLSALQVVAFVRLALPLPQGGACRTVGGAQGSVISLTSPVSCR